MQQSSREVISNRDPGRGDHFEGIKTSFGKNTKNFHQKKEKDTRAHVLQSIEGKQTLMKAIQPTTVRHRSARHGNTLKRNTIRPITNQFHT